MQHSPYLAATCLDMRSRVQAIRAEAARQRGYGRIAQAIHLGNQATRLALILAQQTRVATMEIA